MWAELPSTFDANHVALLPTAGGTVYVDALRNDWHLPLAVLPFLQHPSAVSASFSRTVNGYEGAAAATAYPWSKVGFDLSANYTAEETGNRIFGGSALVDDYLLPNVRVAAGYWGSRTYQPQQDAGLTIWPEQYLAFDGARLLGEWLTHSWLLSLTGQLAAFEQQAQGVISPEFPYEPPVTYLNVYGSVSAAGTRYLSRRWSITLSTALAGENSGGAAARGSVLTETLAASTQLFFNDYVFASLGYQANLLQSRLPPGWSYLPTAPFTATSPFTSTVWLEVAARL